MTDTLGWRMKFGVLVPSTNTTVQPEYDVLRPPWRHQPRPWLSYPQRADTDRRRVISS